MFSFADKECAEGLAERLCEDIAMAIGSRRGAEEIEMHHKCSTDITESIREEDFGRRTQRRGGIGEIV